MERTTNWSNLASGIRGGKRRIVCPDGFIQEPEGPGIVHTPDKQYLTADDMFGRVDTGKTLAHIDFRPLPAEPKGATGKRVETLLTQRVKAEPNLKVKSNSPNAIWDDLALDRHNVTLPSGYKYQCHWCNQRDCQCSWLERMVRALQSAGLVAKGPWQEIKS